MVEKTCSAPYCTEAAKYSENLTIPGREGEKMTVCRKHVDPTKTDVQKI